MTLSDSFFQQLNDSQRKAVEYCDGASLVIAGAGSGKTRVLTYKVAYLMHIGYQPWNILALTFTNKAATEMKSRIARIVGEELAAYLNMGTFHSVFARILRIESQKIGYGSNYTIYDENDSKNLMKNIIKELNLDDTKYKPASVLNTISLAKNRLITAEMYQNDEEARLRDREAKTPDIHLIYTIYQQRCRQANVMDFDDLLVNTYLLFRDHEDVRQKYEQRFSFVLVDEYQDTNYAQQQIVYQLTSNHQHVCVVGDDAQSIYAFRGANIENILGFQSMYHDTRLFKLERNYRSTQKIVKAANSLISHNQRQIQKDVFSQNDEGEPLLYMPLYSDKEEVVVVSKKIRNIIREENCTYSDFAILYRTNAQSRAFEEQFRKDGIPYRIFGGLSFYQRKEVKDVIAYFRVVVNPDDEEALRRIINYPARGIGNVSLGKMLEFAHQHNISPWSSMSDLTNPEMGFSRGAIDKINRFKQLMEGFIQRMNTEDVYSLGLDIVKSSGIAAELLADKSPEGISRKDNVEELLNGMKDFVDQRREEGRENEVYMSDFLQEVALLTDLDGGDDGNGNDRVSLMTIHGAKGLEFPTVFIVGMEENIFPSPMSTNTMKELEEERRLLYVAITRAEKHCFLTSAQNRMRYGRPEFNPKSRFLADIDGKYMRVQGENLGQSDWKKSSAKPWAQNSRPVASQFMADPKPRVVTPQLTESNRNSFSSELQRLQQMHGGRLKPVRPSSPSSSSSYAAPDGLRVGCMIEHQRFGVGEVLKIEGTGENTKVTVSFRNTGTKQLLVKFAKFKIVG